MLGNYFTVTAPSCFFPEFHISEGSVTVSGFIFKFLIHFELIFVYGVR